MTNLRQPRPDCQRDTFQTGRRIRHVFKRNIRVTLMKKRTDRVFLMTYPETSSSARSGTRSSYRAQQLAGNRYKAPRTPELLTLGRQATEPNAFSRALVSFMEVDRNHPLESEFDAEFSLDQALYPPQYRSRPSRQYSIVGKSRSALDGCADVLPTRLFRTS